MKSSMTPKPPEPGSASKDLARQKADKDNKKKNPSQTKPIPPSQTKPIRPPQTKPIPPSRPNKPPTPPSFQKLPYVKPKPYI